MATSLAQIATNTTGLGSGTGSIVTELGNIVAAMPDNSGIVTALGTIAAAIAPQWETAAITPETGVTDNGSVLYRLSGTDLGFLLLDITNSSGGSIAAASDVLTTAVAIMGVGFCNAGAGQTRLNSYGSGTKLIDAWPDGVRLRGGYVVIFV